MRERDLTTQKLFIVARSNPTVYRQLHRTVGREAGVEIIYDRRPPVREPGKLRRFISRVRWLLRFGSDQILDSLDRRQRQQINEQLRTNGWAVVRFDPPGAKATASSSAQPQHRPLTELGSGRPATSAEPVASTREEADRTAGRHRLTGDS
jgi:hypothetical protein